MKVLTTVTASVKVAVLVIPPPVPVTVMVDVPAFAVFATVRVTKAESSAVPVALPAEKPAVTPAGSPDAARLIPAEKPYSRVTLKDACAVLPAVALTDVVAADSRNVGAETTTGIATV